MNDILSLIGRHGYVFLFAAVLAEALGLPVPAALALIAAGAAAASGTLKIAILVLVSTCAMLLGDSMMYILGRYMGWALLGVLCRLSMNPETCILRSAESFYKRGKTTLVVSKFIPGVNTMAPPLAGSMKMRFPQFLRLDLVGISLYVVAYSLLGFAFRDFLVTIVRGYQAAGRVVEVVTIAALIAYIAYRVWIYSRTAAERVVPRVQVQELARKLSSEQAGSILLVDVRSHGYYDEKAERIKGSIRLEPNDLSEELKALPRDKDIYLYCT
jgi:membrane protein DedA with SNARE-associated domain